MNPLVLNRPIRGASPWGALLLVVLLSGRGESAPALLVDHLDGSRTTSAAGAMHGLEFTVATPVILTDLGVWDLDSDGLVANHEVGLWTNDGELLAQTTVRSGTSSLLSASGNASGGWRFEPLNSPQVLRAGATYVVAAHYPAGDAVGDLAGDSVWGGVDALSSITLLPKPEVELGPHRFHVSGADGLVFPARQGDFWTALFGANARVVSVPEPAAVSMMIGLASCSMLFRTTTRRW